jgi:plasmid stabilization system protein ParE
VQNRSKPQLTGQQQRRVDEARQIADAEARDVAGNYGHTPAGPYGYAFGAAQSVIKALLDVIAELADEQSAADRAVTEQLRRDGEALGHAIAADLDEQTGGPLGIVCVRPGEQDEQTDGEK